VYDVVPDFIDPANDGPLPGREDDWALMTGYRVRLASDERNLIEAERLQRVRVDGDRRLAQPHLAATPGRLNQAQRSAIDGLAVSLQELAHIQREWGNPVCAATFREAFELANAVGNSSLEAVCAFNLGHVYTGIAELHNLDEAEHWYRKSLDLHAPGDRLGRGTCLGQLGQIAYGRFEDAHAAKRPIEELACHLIEAAQRSQQALDMFSATAVAERGIAHNQLGVIYHTAGNMDRALHHYRQSIQYADQTGDIFEAGDRRFNVAASLLDDGRLSDARAYAEAALANYQTFGGRTEDRVRTTERLIVAIDQAIAEKGGGA
jgi:tetratricopeptide (TPR) repeat protein